MIPEWMLLMRMTAEERRNYEENGRILRAIFEAMERRSA